MKSIDCKMRTNFTIQKCENISNSYRRIKNILDVNYKQANLKKKLNNFTIKKI